MKDVFVHRFSNLNMITIGILLTNVTTHAEKIGKEKNDLYEAVLTKYDITTHVNYNPLF